MRAAVYHRYGSPDVVHIAEVPKPTVARDEVLVRVRATTITAGDWRVRSGVVPRGLGILSRLALGVFRPRKRVLGTELAGEVEAVGASVTRFRSGDKVFAYRGERFGCHAEYVAVREDEPIVHMPAGLSFAQAAALSFGGSTALMFLRDKAQLRAGQRVLINGASGGVGTAAVQLAKYFGAHVTAVCSAANADLVRGLGADVVIDYGREDFATSGATWDVILDAVGNCSYTRCQAALAPGGTLLLLAATLGQLLGAGLRPRRAGGRRVVAGVAWGRREELTVLGELAAAGKLTAPIDRTFPFVDIVAAYRAVDSRHKRGNVVLELGA